MSTEKSLRQIFNVNEERDISEPITGIHLEKFPRFESKYFVMITTPSRFYQFVGDATQESPMFASVLSVFDPDPTIALTLKVSK